jgi:hypothetical protein
MKVEWEDYAEEWAEHVHKTENKKVLSNKKNIKIITSMWRRNESLNPVKNSALNPCNSMRTEPKQFDTLSSEWDTPHG